ncbi:hypothetical protein D9619_006811 [Psilocybe cf. subviscida]|uniref:RING-type domain-containing protein n=1 Tax=Psilocybe cf. subviscida TaxID=2480587 RepID=A0A8H5EXX0_9AGAR|nr:hypothetical protein D9619_006811 [Psilocybe cf. subviscida]
MEAKELVQKRQEEQRALRLAREAAAVDTFIVSQYNLVEIGAGLKIRKVIPGFELCRITVKNLPMDATRREIADIFLAQGVPTANFFVFPLKRNGSKLEAIIWVDATQGQLIAIGLEGVEFRDKTLSFEVGDNANWNIGRSLPFLTVSWYAPSDVIDAKYGTMREAEGNMGDVNAMNFKGRKMRAIMNQSSRNVHDLPSIRIMGCPPGSTYDIEFLNFIHTPNFRLAHSISFDERATEHWVWTTLRWIRGALRGTCTRILDGIPNGETKYKIQFESYQYAKEAYDIMARYPAGQHNSATFRCWLPKPKQHVTAIPLRQYKAQRRQWDALAAKEGTDAYVLVTPGTKDVVFINAVGEDKKAAGPLKVRVESLIAGEKLDTTTHWHPSFAIQDLTYDFNSLYSLYRVHVRYDAKGRCLRIYGEDTARAAKKIASQVKLMSQTETVKELDRQELRYFVKEGLGKLKELVGDDNVVLDVGSTPATINVRGGAESEHHLQRLMTESRHRRFEVSQHTAAGQGNVVCPICTDHTSNPERIGCGHTYCTACLKHFLTTATVFPLACMGNDGNCKVPIALPFISRFLPAQVFQAHIESAFAAYVERHSRELKYCTTPDCTQIYRRRRDVQELQCPSCFSSICPSCDAEAHEGMTCRERRIYRDPALQERLDSALAEEQG